MVDYIITLDDTRDQVVALAARARGQTNAQYVQERAVRDADAALAAMYEQWFASRSLSEKKTIYDSNRD